MTIRIGALLVAAVLALAAPVDAEIGVLDQKPAATLLLPYFEVDLNSPIGITTLLSINNAAATSALAHVTLWTDYSYPTLVFPVFLTGFDVQTINLRDVFNGILPITGPSVHPAGTLSSSNTTFPSCAGLLPSTNPALSATFRQTLATAHTGQPVVALGNACAGADLGGGIARGYVTIDNVQACSVQAPGSAGYFVDGGVGVASNLNRLWGDYFIVDEANNFAFGETLVHVEANNDLKASQIPLLDPDTGATATTVPNATGYTFYGRYSADGRDNREPLGTVWGARYLNGGQFTGGTELIVWRDSTANDVTPTVGWCAGGPSWHPLSQAQVVAFDEQENALEICAATECFPRETGRYDFGVGDLAVPYPFGWVYLNLNLPPDSPTGDRDFGTSGNIAQSSVTVISSAEGRYQVGLSAVKLRGAFVDDPN